MKKLFVFDEPNIWTALAHSQKPIVLYGMGNAADRVLDECEKRGIRIAGVMASDDFCRYQAFRGFTVKKESDFEREFSYSAPPQTSIQSLSRHTATASSPEAAPPLSFGHSPNGGTFPKGSLSGDFSVALCFGSSLPDVMRHVYEVNERHTVLVPNIPVVGDSIMDDAFIGRYKEDIERAYALLADEMSRRVFKGALDFYYSGRLEYLQQIESGKDEVFRDILRLQNERYLDLGAYRGDTVDEFLRYTDGYESITAVEPNPKNYQKLCEHLAGMAHTEALNAGIAEKSGVMRISKKAGRMPSLGDEGIAVPVTTVDDLDLSPTYIKVDIEGMERAMLLGAQQTLTTQKPKLNLAAYHRTGDFFSLILQLHAINPTYKIYLRKHPYIPCWDLNIYAV